MNTKQLSRNWRWPGVLLLLAFAAQQTMAAPLECADVSKLKIIGELEYVTFLPEKSRQKARIDTGAQTSSLGIADHDLFERDGKRWIRFTLLDEMRNELIEFERPLKRTIRIKRHQAEAIERPVVELKIRIGGSEMKREFTLADREQFTYRVLIGRNVLNNRFLVNVGQKFSSSSIVEEGQ